MNLLQLTPFSRLGLSIILGLVLTLIAFSTIHAQEPGDLDPTFNALNNSGIVTTPIGSGSFGHAVAIQPDRKIVVAGSTENGSETDFAVARYTSDGTLDPEFNNGTGIVTSPIRNMGGASGVAIQPDSKIVVAGYFGVVRYTITGTLDTDFNGTGIVTYAGGSDVAIQPSDGRIVVAGSYGENFRVVRYEENGNPDTTFGNAGIATAPIGMGYGTFGRSLAIQSDGKIVVAGEVLNSNISSDVTIVRFTITGSVDINFNGSGVVTIPLGPGENLGYSVAIQPDEKIVVTGVDNSGDTPRVLLARINDDGILDTAFGSNGSGVVTTSIGSNGIGGLDIAVQKNGKIVVAGTNEKSNGDSDIAVLRYNSDGTLDIGFGQSGIVTTPLGGTYDVGRSVAIQSDGKIVVAGWESDAPMDDFPNHFAVVRYMGDNIQYSYLPLIFKD